MAQLQLQSPEQFNFKELDDWQQWKRRFEQFWVALGLKEESDTKQVSILLYSKRYDKVIEKLDAFFQTRKNVIFERARFNHRNQLEGESAQRNCTSSQKIVTTEK